MAAKDETLEMPLRFIDLKQQIIPQDEEGQKRLTESWNDLLGQLKSAVEEFKKDGPNIIPQFEHSDLKNITPSQKDLIRKRGAVVIKNVVDDEQAAAWKEELAKFVKENPVDGFPEEDKQFFMLYWTRPQVQARAHPNVLDATSWLNSLYHTSSSSPESLELTTPLTYADRFRIRHPGVQWDAHPPHIDGGGIERWEDVSFRKCYSDILSGNWAKHDPYELQGRIDAKTSLYKRPGQASAFRTFQGWLALSPTAPTQGTLKVFPDVILSNAYLILRPFFRPIDTPVSSDPLDAENWEFDVSTPTFPGIFPTETGFRGPRLTPASHPHLRLEESMTSVPAVEPGDMVFWHCDVVHSVEVEHTGVHDSAVMYIPAVPATPQNKEYIKQQVETFLKGVPPPDFPNGPGEAAFAGTGVEKDVVGEAGRKALGLAY